MSRYPIFCLVNARSKQFQLQQLMTGCATADWWRLWWKSMQNSMQGGKVLHIFFTIPRALLNMFCSWALAETETRLRNQAHPCFVWNDREHTDGFGVLCSNSLGTTVIVLLLRHTKTINCIDLLHIPCPKKYAKTSWSFQKLLGFS